MFDDWKDNTGEPLNLLESPEAFTVYMLDYGVRNVLSNCPFVTENWDEEFELTADAIEQILNGCDASKSAARKASRTKKADKPMALWVWQDNDDGSYTLFDMFGHEFTAYEPRSFTNLFSDKWVLDVAWGNEDASDWGEGGYPHTIGEFDTAGELDDYVTSVWYNQDRWAKKSSRAKTALQKKIAGYGEEVAWDIEGLLDSDGPFEDEDAVQEYIDSCIDNALIYYADMWKVIEEYGDPQEIWEQNEGIYLDFYDAVMGEIGDLSRWVKEEDEEY